MPTSPNRRRIEIDAEVYDMLDRQARWLHIPVAAAATMLLRESLARYELQRPADQREEARRRMEAAGATYVPPSPAQEAEEAARIEADPYHPIHQERARQARERAIEDNPHLQEDDLRY